MTGNPLEFFQPTLGYWSEEKERQRHETHQYFVSSPPLDSYLDAGVIELDLPDLPEPAAQVKPRPGANSR